MKNPFSEPATDTLLHDFTPTVPVNIAYFILVHRLPNQFKRLFRAIYAPGNCYLIHIDKKASKELKEEVQLFLQSFTNAYVMESENVVWGGYSMVQAELDGIKYLLARNAGWDYFINLSGQDYPLKSQKIIRQFLEENQGKSYLKIANQALARLDTMNRIENHDCTSMF